MSFLHINCVLASHLLVLHSDAQRLWCNVGQVTSDLIKG